MASGGSPIFSVVEVQSQMSSLMASIEDTIGNLRRDIAATRTINAGPVKTPKRHGNRRGSDTVAIKNLHHPIKTTPSLPVAFHSSPLRDTSHFGGYSPITETSPQIGAHYEEAFFDVRDPSPGQHEKESQSDPKFSPALEPGLQSVMDVMNSTMDEFQRMNALTNQQAAEIQRLKDGLARIEGQENSIYDLQAAIDKLMARSKHENGVEETVASLKLEVVESSGSIAELRTVISSVESNMREQREHLTDMKGRFEAAAEAVSSVGESKQTLGELAIAIQETAECCASRQDVEEVFELLKNQSQKIADLEEELSQRHAASDRVDRMEVKMEELTAQLDGVHQSIASLEKRLPEATQLAKRQDEQMLKLQTLFSRVAELSNNHVGQEDIQSLLVRLDEACGCIPRVKELDQALSQSQAQHNDKLIQLEAQVGSLKEIVLSNDISDLSVRVDNLQSTVASLESECSQAAVTLETISSDVVGRSEFQALEDAVQDIRNSTEVQSLKATVDELRAWVDPRQIESLVEGLDDLDRRSTSNGERIDEVATEALSAANDRIDAVRCQVESLVSLKESHKSTTHAIQRLETYNAECNGKLETLASGVDRFYAGAEELACLSNNVDCLFTKVEEMSSICKNVETLSEGLEDLESIRSEQLRVGGVAKEQDDRICQLSSQLKGLLENQVKREDIENLTTELVAMSKSRDTQSLAEIQSRMDQLSAHQGSLLEAKNLQGNVQEMEKKVGSLEHMTAVQNDHHAKIATILSSEETNRALLDEHDDAIRTMHAKQAADSTGLEDSLGDLWCKLDAQGEDIQELKDRYQGESETADVKKELDNFVEKVNIEMEDFSNQLSEVKNWQASLENKEKDLRLGLKSLKSQVRDVDCALEKSFSNKEDRIEKILDEKEPPLPGQEVRVHDVESGLQDNPLFEEPHQRPPPSVLPTPYPVATCIVSRARNDPATKATSVEEPHVEDQDPADTRLSQLCEAQCFDEIEKTIAGLPSLPTVEESKESTAQAEDEDCVPNSEVCSFLSREDCEGTLEEVLGLACATHYSHQSQAAAEVSLDEKSMSSITSSEYKEQHAGDMSSDGDDGDDFSNPFFTDDPNNVESGGLLRGTSVNLYSNTPTRFKNPAFDEGWDQE